MTLELRHFDCRAEVDASDLVIHGTAIVFERWQRVAMQGEAAYAGSGKTREKIVTTAVRLSAEGKPEVYRQYRSKPIKALVNHTADQYLASTDSGLKLTKTQQGLEFEIRLPNTTRSRDLVALAKAEGQLPTSIGFVGRGRASKITQKKNFTEIDEDNLDDIRSVTSLDNQPPELQPADKPLDGSDWTEGIDPRTGRRWRVYHSLDLREISILEGLDPAWEGVSAKLGNQPDQRSKAKAWLTYYELSQC